MSAFGEGQLAAHWLQKSATGTYDYDVRVAISPDDGQNWGPSFIPHTDGVAAEHGFVTMLPLENGRIFATWLDGRNTKGEGHDTGDGHGHGGGPMTLRAAEFDANGQLFSEAELDARVCDCCQTDAAITSQGPVVVYRDRSKEEIRDISIVRQVDGRWLAPQPIHHDGWTIAGCPVNGPAIAAKGESVAVAWFTSASEEAQVKVAFSEDAGATFSDPIRVDDGENIGRVDIVLVEQGHAIVSWVEQLGDTGEVRLASVGPQGKLGKSWAATATDLSRQSGFPILEKIDQNRCLLAWTAVDSLTTIKSGIIAF